MTKTKITFFMPALIVLVMFASSCSTYFQTPSQNNDIDRAIAAEATPPLNSDQLFTFKSIGLSHVKNNKSLIAGVFSNIQGVQVQLVEDSQMSSDIAYKIVPTIENQKYVVKVFHSAKALLDDDASSEVVKFMQNTNKLFTSQFSLFELYFNAKAQDFITLKTIAKMRSLTYISAEAPSEDFANRYADQISYWQKISDRFATEERVYNKKVNVQEAARRAVMDALDKVAEDQQFRNLVAKNDRVGATKLLRQYLPWEQMPPFEKLFWETHLKIMVNPLPIQDRVLVYRGIDDDIIQVAQEAGSVLTREEATKEQKMFLMSTMMTKNQGTWNRRLRSLTAMYEKFMGTDSAGSSEFTKTTRITNMFIKHSLEPKGSPFLSYTPKINVAQNFGSKKMTSYLIDPRLLYFNYASKFASEIEFLLPIMSFPDELAGIYDKDIHSAEFGSDVKAFLKNKAIEKLDRELGSGKGAAAYTKIEADSQKFFKPVIGGTGGAVQAVVPDGKFMSFFKKILGLTPKKVDPVPTAHTDMPCLDLIQLFWH